MTAPKMYFATELDTGSYALNSIDGAILSDGDSAIVAFRGSATYGDAFILYIVNATSGATESLPSIVSPATNAGNKRWIFSRVLGMLSGANQNAVTSHDLAHDTTGAIGVGNDRIIKTVDGSGNQWPVGQKIVNISFAFVKPQSWPDGARDKWIPWYNETGMDFTITRIFCTCSSATTIAISTTNSRTNSGINSAIGTIAIDTAGTGIYYKTTLANALTNTVIGFTRGLAFDFHDTDDPEQGEIMLQGWFDAGVT